MFLGEMMSAFGKDVAVILRFIRNLHGGSQPILVRASDGLTYVVKFANNLQGANLLFNESAGSELYRACGLEGPAWKPLLVTDAFLDDNPDCWLQTPEGRLRPASGLCFASRFLGGEGVRLLEILPGSSFKRIRNHEDFWLAWLIDICARHADNRQAVFQEDAQGWLHASFIDHGHLFGGPEGDKLLHFQASRYLDARIYQNVSQQHLLNVQRVAASLDVDRLWQEVQGLPEEWKTASALDGLTQCFARLATAQLVQGVLDAMVDAHERTHGSFCREYQRGPKPPLSVLRPGVQAGQLEQRVFGNRAGYPACAVG
jgi:hypothetical protein